LNYPKIAKRLNWEEAKTARFIDLIRFKADVVGIEGVAAHVPDDPDDSPILATLIAGKADCLVTGDEDLLKLADKHPILTPAAFHSRIL
jgi:uncharacterized protein